MAFDRYGRHINYLRVSLTDHCNLRCRYCMPEEMSFIPNEACMNDDEVLFFVELFARLGFDKVRLTGGEPTIRPGVVELVRRIAATPGIAKVTMTSNGLLFAGLAEPLMHAGLQRVNFSLDTLDMEKYRQLTRRDALPQVLAGIQAAEAAGLTPIKLNVVVVRDFNVEEVSELAQLTLQHPWQVRFIELMPFGGNAGFQLEQVVSAAEIQQRVESRLGVLEEVLPGKLDGEARLYRLPGAPGDIGFISSVTQPFCSECNRVRLTADGRLRLCLLCDAEVDLLTALRRGVSNDEMRTLVVEAIWRKPWGNRLAEGAIPASREMSQIGG